MLRMRRNKPAHFRVRAKIIARLSASSLAHVEVGAREYFRDGISSRGASNVMAKCHGTESCHGNAAKSHGNDLEEGGSVGRPFPWGTGTTPLFPVRQQSRLFTILSAESETINFNLCTEMCKLMGKAHNGRSSLSSQKRCSTCPNFHTFS